MIKGPMNVGFITAFLFVAVLPVSLSYPQTRYRRSLVEINDPNEVMRVLAGLMDNLIVAESGKTEKRGLDLGLSRGFSGSQAAKHLMGLAAANFAGGPGRRRRDVSKEE
ncbi:diuretic hormone class 2-like [Limulus polyphemus]|uniref:Diuretic hormone class 2-like n=1 Tax=Limulus polyphemus TaxID=6850 RepID=A0ABM1BT48_LIMPO|nr:diuretic hormone class 2-like [Limulus polyphemus]